MKGRRFEDASSLANIARIRKLLARSKRGLTVKEVAKKLALTERRTRDYLNHMHGGAIYVASWDDERSRGKKLARFLLKKEGCETDAPKWWLEDAQ